MTSSTPPWNGSTGTTTGDCTASLATSRPTSSKPPTTLNQRSSNRNRHQHEAGNEPETVQGTHRAAELTRALEQPPRLEVTHSFLWRPSCYLRMLTARAMTSATVIRDTKDWPSIVSFAHRV